MKKQFLLSIITLLFLFGGSITYAMENITFTPSDSDDVAGLDLQAVGDLFKESKNLEDFEKALNDPDRGINNLDLDNNGEVDYIRVNDETADNTHIVVLQVPTAKDEYQDVATIEVEKTDDDYNLQIHGNNKIYGKNVYVVPTVVQVHTWPIIGFMYAPAYRPYRSAFYFGYYPHWWHPFHPVARHIYYTRVLPHRKAFTITKTTRVKTVSRVHYTPHSSKVVVKKTTIKKNGKTKTVKKKKVKVK